MSDHGKKIDELRISGHNAILRWHTHKAEFTIEVFGLTFTGEDYKEIRRKAELELEGYKAIDWKPVIVINPHPEETLVVCYQRMFRGRDKEGEHFRYWMIGTENEGNFGRWNPPKTGDQIELGQPGNLIHGRETRGKTLAYTEERWKALRTLHRALEVAIERAREKLEEILKSKGLDGFLLSIGQNGAGALPWIGEKDASALPKL